MSQSTESRHFEDVYVSDVRVISGIRPAGRLVDKSAERRQNNGLLYVWNGEATFRDGGKIIVARSGDLVYIPKNKNYRMEFTAEQTTFVLVNFEFFNSSGEAVLLHNEISILAKDSAENGIARTMTSFELCSTSMDAAAIFRRRELLYRLLGMAYGTSYDLSADNGSDAKITDATALIEKSYLENIPISELADACHVSENTFRTVFRKKHKTSPVQYRNRLRIARAKELLSEGSCTVQEAAWGSGFENVGYFCRLYKRLTGETPNETKKKTNSI